MDEQKPEPSKPSGGYRSNWVKYLLIYLAVGGLVYLLVYLIWFSDGYGG